MSENTYTIKEIKKALRETDSVAYQEKYVGDPDFEYIYNILKKHLIRNKRNSMITAKDKALSLIAEYGGIDGAHHKQWLLDEVVKILADDYDQWVRDYEDGEDSKFTYSWDTGIAP